MRTELLHELHHRLGLTDHDEVIDAALEVLEKLTSGKGEVYSMRSGDAEILCWSPFNGQPEHLYVYERGEDRQLPLVD